MPEGNNGGGKTFKLMLSKAMEQYECRNINEWKELVDVVNFQKHRLLMRNGHSPIQRVIGYRPKLPAWGTSQCTATQPTEHILTSFD